MECTECSLVCAHAAIRPYLLNSDEMAKAPAGLLTRQGEGAEPLKTMRYRIQVYPEDCTGCSSCATICPGHALTMMPIEGELPYQVPLLDFVERNVSIKTTSYPVSLSTVRSSTSLCCSSPAHVPDAVRLHM